MADVINTRAAQVLAALPAGEVVSVSTLQAAHPELSRHQARRVLQRLEDDGAIERLARRGPRGAALYQQKEPNCATEPKSSRDLAWPARSDAPRPRPGVARKPRSGARRPRLRSIYAAPAVPPRQAPSPARPVAPQASAAQAVALARAALAPFALLYLPLIAALLVGPRLPGAARTTAAAVSGAARAYGALVYELGVAAVEALEAPSRRRPHTILDQLAAGVGVAA